MMLAACQRFHPDQAPDGWVVEPLRKRLRLEYGSGLTDGERHDGPFAVYGSNGKVGMHSAYQVEGPGILVGRKGSVGEVHFSEGNFWPIDTVYYVRRLANEDWRFLYYLLLHINLGQLNAATGVPGLTRRDAHFMFGAFPPLPEQAAIGGILKLADDTLSAFETKLAGARRLKTALMQQLFTRGLPGRHGEFIELPVLRHRHSIPKDWEPTQLTSCIQLIDYGTNSPSNDQKMGYPVVAIPQVVGPRFRLGTCPHANIPKDEADSVRLQPDDVLMVRTNGNPDFIGKSTVIGEEAASKHIVFASYLIRVRTRKERLLGSYLNYFLASPLGRRQALAMANTSAGNHNLGTRAIRQFWLPRPSVKEQGEAVVIVNAVEDNIEAIEREIEALRRLKTSLLQNLLTGKVRVKVEAGAKRAA